MSYHLKTTVNRFNLTGVVSSRITMPQSIRHDGSLNDLMSVKMMGIICSGLHSHQITIPLSKCKSVTQHIKTLNDRILFGRILFPPSGRVSMSCTIGTLFVPLITHLPVYK